MKTTNISSYKLAATEVKLSLEDLTGKGANGAYRLSVGNTIVFPDTLKEVVITSMPFKSSQVYKIVAIKDSNVISIPIGQLRNLPDNFEELGFSKFQRDLNAMSDFRQVVEMLIGKTIRVSARVDGKVHKRDGSDLVYDEFGAKVMVDKQFAIFDVI